MSPTRILQPLGGPVLLKPGGHSQLTMIFGSAVLCGQVSTIAVNQLLTNGLMFLPISVLWTSVAFQRIFITTIKAGGQIKTCFTFRHTGIGRERRVSPSM